MKHIKTITRSDISLTHHRYVDDFGFEQEAIEIIKTRSDGVRVHVPITPPFKVKNSTDWQKGTDYTDEEYEKMLVEGSKIDVVKAT